MIDEDPPPFWGQWKRLYVFVAALLLVETALFYALARWAS